MDKGDRLELFSRELDLLQSETLREFARFCLEHAPDYFFHVSASASGSYHPPFANGEGGLVRHTKATILIAQDLAELQQYQFAKLGVAASFDLIIMALMFHDVLKFGLSNSGKTNKHHAEDAAEWMLLMDQMFGQPIEDIGIIAALMRTHMGQWGYSCYSEESTPVYAAQKLVHMADFIASRKWLTISYLVPEEPNVSGA